MEMKGKDLEISHTEAVGDVSKTTVTDECHDRDRKLKQLREKIIDCWNQCDGLYLEIGKDLLAAKGLFGKYGEWLGWLKMNVPFSVRQAQRLMRVAEWFGNTTLGSHLDFSKAYLLTRLPQARVTDFLAQYKRPDIEVEPLTVIQNMSKLDLEKAIREYLLSSPSVQHTHKCGKTEVNSPVASSADRALNALSDLESTMSRLMENIINRRIDDEEYDTVISEIRRLCEDTLGKLPSEDVKIE